MAQCWVCWCWMLCAQALDAEVAWCWVLGGLVLGALVVDAEAGLSVGLTLGVG